MRLGDEGGTKGSRNPYPPSTPLIPFSEKVRRESDVPVCRDKSGAGAADFSQWCEKILGLEKKFFGRGGRFL